MGDVPTIEDAAIMLRTIAELRQELDASERYGDQERQRRKAAEVFRDAATSRAERAEAAVETLTAERDALRTQLEKLQKQARVAYDQLFRASRGATLTEHQAALLAKNTESLSDLQHLAVNAACALAGHLRQHPQLVERWEAERARADQAEAERDALRLERDEALKAWEPLAAQRNAAHALLDGVRDALGLSLLVPADQLHAPLPGLVGELRAERDALRERLAFLVERAIKMLDGYPALDARIHLDRAVDDLEHSARTWRAEVEAAVLREAADYLEKAASVEDAGRYEHEQRDIEREAASYTVAAVLRGKALVFRTMATTRGAK